VLAVPAPYWWGYDHRGDQAKAGHGPKGTSRGTKSRDATLWVGTPFWGKEQIMLITTIITLIVVGVLLWLVNNKLPMDGTIKTIINVVVIIAVVLWLLRSFGVM
jgi:hypothetical protein